MPVNEAQLATNAQPVDNETSKGVLHVISEGEKKKKSIDSAGMGSPIRTQQQALPTHHTSHATRT